jgi:hypothetical protein
MAENIQLAFQLAMTNAQLAILLTFSNIMVAKSDK